HIVGRNGSYLDREESQDGANPRSARRVRLRGKQQNLELVGKIDVHQVSWPSVVVFGAECLAGERVDQDRSERARRPKPNGCALAQVPEHEDEVILRTN